MSDENIRKHLRAALDEVISAETAFLHKKLDDQDAVSASREQMMRPVIEALDSFRTEVGVFEWLAISLDTHSATIDLMKKTYSSSSHTLTISTNEEISAFEVAEDYWCDIPAYCNVKYHECSSAEEVLKLVVVAVGERIAVQQVTIDRLKNKL